MGRFDFKVGDRVRIRQWDDMEKEYGIEHGDIKLRPVFNGGSMRKLCGKERRIKEIIEEEGVEKHLWKVKFHEEKEDKGSGLNWSWTYVLGMIEKATFKVGDKVRVRSWADLEREFGTDDNGHIPIPKAPHFVTSMRRYCGKEFVIKYVKRNCVNLEDCGTWNFAFETIALTESKGDKPVFKVGERVYVRTVEDLVAEFGKNEAGSIKTPIRTLEGDMRKICGTVCVIKELETKGENPERWSVRFEGSVYHYSYCVMKKLDEQPAPDGCEFKVGDRVRVREWDAMVDDYREDSDGDIDLGEDGGYFLKRMKPCCGKERIIASIDGDGWDYIAVTFEKGNETEEIERLFETEEFYDVCLEKIEDQPKPDEGGGEVNSFEEALQVLASVATCLGKPCEACLMKTQYGCDADRKKCTAIAKRAERVAISYIEGKQHPAIGAKCGTCSTCKHKIEIGGGWLLCASWNNITSPEGHCHKFESTEIATETCG